MSGIEFRTMTILHTENDAAWCKYVLDKFNADKLKLKIVTLDVSSLEYENPPEIHTAVAESYVVLFLTTSYMLEYLERHPGWLAPLLQRRDNTVTTIVAGLLGVSAEDLSQVTAQHKYDTDKQWVEMEIDVHGANIKECIMKILEFTDGNAERLSKRTATRTYSDRTTRVSPGTQEAIEIVPSYVHQTGETIAIIFTKEKSKGSVTVSAGDTKMEVHTINPYCVTFKAPEMTSPKLKVHVEVNNKKFHTFTLRAMKSPHFTSLELMCQSYGVSKKEDLDKKLAETFISSMPADTRIMTTFTDLIRSDPTGNRNHLYPTVLHWAAANGLKELCSALMSAPGAHEICNILNRDDDDVADLAERNGHIELADFITEFTETKLIADACDRYVQSCYAPSGGSPIYEDMSPKACPKLTSPTVPSRKPAPFSVPPRLPSHEEDDGDYVLPEPVLPMGSIGCRSQAELIEIQVEVKNGNFSIQEAEMLFNSWKSRYETGNAISFKEKQQSLQAMRQQYQKHISVLKDKCVKQKKAKKHEPAVTQAVQKISEPVGMRKMVGVMLPSPGPGRAGSGGSLSLASHDSGRYSNRESNLSQTSTSSDEYEGFDERLIMRGSRSQSDRSSDRPPDIRHSTRDLYLELTRASADIPDTTQPPPLPPRMTKQQTQEAKQPPQVKQKPAVTPKPQPSIPPKTYATLPHLFPKR
ncbi:hypothetical protein BsWGS_06561 [Bradybaena similaris]